MYAVSSSSRVYISFLLLLCSAFLFAPSVVNASEYWSVLEKRFIPSNEVPSAVQNMLGHDVKRPTGTNVSVTNQPTFSQNPSGGLSATTQNVIRNMGKPSGFSSTINNSVNSAKSALKSCTRSPACAGRALGAGGLLYEGIKGWKDVYDILQDPVTNDITIPDYENIKDFEAPEYPNPTSQVIAVAGNITGASSCPASNQHGTVVACEVSSNPNNQYVRWTACKEKYGSLNLVGFLRPYCQYADDDPWEQDVPRVPLSPEELDNLIDEGYEPAVSDAPITFLSDSPPASISLSTPEPVQLPSTTTTNTSSSGTTTTVSNQTINYNVVNNNTTSPSINSSTTTTTITYDDAANVVDTTTSTTNEEGVQADVPPRSPAPTAPPVELDFDLPSFCSWASIVCNWIGWTQESLDYDEPDLTVLISEFEPDEDEYNLGIGDGVCPAPIQLNIIFINKTVEVSYQPFCDFVTMIRPFILAAAYLFAAYLYIGVLKRG